MSLPTPIRLAVLISGSGTTLQNFTDRIADGRMRAEIALVISSISKAFDVERARNARIPCPLMGIANCSGSPEFKKIPRTQWRLAPR